MCGRKSIEIAHFLQHSYFIAALYCIVYSHAHSLCNLSLSITFYRLLIRKLILTVVFAWSCANSPVCLAFAISICFAFIDAVVSVVFAVVYLSIEDCVDLIWLIIWSIENPTDPLNWDQSKGGGHDHCYLSLLQCSTNQQLIKFSVDHCRSFSQWCCCYRFLYCSTIELNRFSVQLL